jgi:hypothetical protein
MAYETSCEYDPVSARIADQIPEPRSEMCGVSKAGWIFAKGLKKASSGGFVGN